MKLFFFEQREIKELKSSRNTQLPAHQDESFSKEGFEFEDSEFFQMTVDKLKKELQDARAECQHWKDAAKNQVCNLTMCI